MLLLPPCCRVACDSNACASGAQLATLLLALPLFSHTSWNLLLTSPPFSAAVPAALQAVTVHHSAVTVQPSSAVRQPGQLQCSDSALNL
eukprot:1160114-Pelagomonas_calceolata.AAC.3